MTISMIIWWKTTLQNIRKKENLVGVLIISAE
jgi:hypothetical protein